MSVYSHKTRVKMYEILLKLFGPYNPEWQIGDDGKLEPEVWGPSNVSNQDRDAAYQLALSSINWDGNKPPKSYVALIQQVLVMTAIRPRGQSPDDLLRNRLRNRLAAYEAGFITMENIVLLERAWNFFMKTNTLPTLADIKF